MNYVYILECADGSFYTGWTNNLEKRIEMHSKGIGAKYTRGRAPVKLIYHEIFENKNDAMKREYAIKRLTREKKLELVSGSLKGI
jgi:putative endonuclease